jgi:CRP-like cAMP-binding protein
MSDLSDKSVNVRIAEALIYLKNKYPNQVWTRKEIAEYTGVPPKP